MVELGESIQIDSTKRIEPELISTRQFREVLKPIFVGILVFLCADKRQLYARVLVAHKFRLFSLHYHIVISFRTGTTSDH